MGCRVLFRADASVAGGAGHVMRAIGLAQEFVARGAAVEFCHRSLTPMVYARLEDEGFSMLALDDGVALSDLAKDRGATTVVVDLGEALTPSMLEGVAAQTVVVDDLGQSFTIPPTLVVNQNLHASRTVYEGVEERDVLRGPEYMLFRNEFLRASRPNADSRDASDRVLLMLGGTDPLRLLSPLAAALAERLSAPVDVVASADHPDLDALRRTASSYGTLNLHHDVADMASLMVRARVAVTSGGTSVWELAALGVPALVGSVASIEDRLLSGLREHGLFQVLGSLADVDPADLAARVDERYHDDEWLVTMSRRARQIVDVAGRRRVVDAIHLRS